MSASRRQLLLLLDAQSDRLREAFDVAIRRSRGRVNVAALTRALEAGDIDAALRAAGVRGGMWSVLTQALRTAYAEAGEVIMDADVPARYGMHFDIENPRASQWLATTSSRLIQGDLTPTQRNAIQVALQQGFDLGQGPRTTALDLVGRISPETGRRVGGLVNLSDPQQEWSTRARKQLVNLDRGYLKRKMRDRRFDDAIEKAIDEGRPLKKTFVDKVIGRYEDRLLKLRGDTIGRTEALNALNTAADESLQQVIDEGLTTKEQVKRIWRHGGFSPDQRPGHVQLEGVAVGPDEVWRNPATNATLIRPGQGPAEEVINCRCTVEHKIEFIQQERVA